MDRNQKAGNVVDTAVWSLSARRAWIEIFWYSSRIIMSVVALRKESVDRNVGDAQSIGIVTGRSPQGERG